MDTLEAIRDGRITVQFRRWRRPTVRSGGTLRTPLGVLEIREVSEVSLDAIDREDASRAGFDSRDALVGALALRPEGRLYRIDLGALRPDPRVALRNRAELGDTEWESLADRLDGYDRRSATGAWTRSILQIIAERPSIRAADLAATIGEDKARFKARVRRLKALGLTESLEVGYRLSPRGAAVLRRLLGAPPS
jgi:hypothetical protein